MELCYYTKCCLSGDLHTLSVRTVDRTSVISSCTGVCVFIILQNDFTSREDAVTCCEEMLGENLLHHGKCVYS